MKKYKRITEDERNEIVVMLSKNKSAREIAKKLLRSAAQIATLESWFNNRPRICV